MEIFNNQNYYPVPSNDVISFGNGVGSNRGKVVLKTDLVALIVHLSSPMGEVDYNAFSDMFLVYRNFMSPMELLDLLVMRFRWCVQEVDTNDERRSHMGKIALVRTFTLLRHWILNYFVQDFISDVHLRMRLIKFLNDFSEKYQTTVRATKLNLKKAWVHSMKKAWTNLKLDEPEMIGKDLEWCQYHILDFTELEEVRKRESQLSAYAKNGASSPSFRNQSVLSLFKNIDIFKLPDKSNTDLKKKNTQRTGSMMLFPYDNSNAKGEIKATSEREEKYTAPEITKDEINGRRNPDHISKVTHLSHVMKEIKCPESPGIDKLIPPTPAKKVEIILKLPENLEENSKLQNEQSDVNMKNENGKSSTSRQPIHRGAVGLLTKWKKNHSSVKINQSTPRFEQIKERYSKPEMDNFVKYVISITSLENREQENAELLNLVHSKFDILSARTIEEVEYLISMENKLIKEVHDTVPHSEISLDGKEKKEEVNNNTDNSQLGFSAVDNLNLYQTVSSIANSVLSLSKALDQHRKNQQPNSALSPSFAALERRKVQSSIPTIMHNRSRFSLISQYNYKEEATQNDGPQRLVFHDNSGYKKFSNVSSSEPVLSTSPSRRIPHQPSNRSSPLKQVLPNVYEISTRSMEHTDSFISSISYDSELSNTVFKAQTSEAHSKSENNFPIKRKIAQNNLREFTFEDKKSEDDAQTSVSIFSSSSFVTTREFEQEKVTSTPKTNTPTKVLASGRISIIQKKNSHLSRHSNHLRTPVEVIKKDVDYIERDKELQKSEREILELENAAAQRLSTATSVNTDILFSSKQNSPRKVNEHQNPYISLNKKPSITSIDDVASFSTNVIEMTPSGSNICNDLSKKVIPSLKQESSGESSFNYLSNNDNGSSKTGMGMSSHDNKYLFSPDSGSIDIASPAKNVEELKDKFLKKEIDDHEANDSRFNTFLGENESEHTNNGSTERRKEDIDSQNGEEKEINKKNIVDIANLPDDSVHDDPVNVALMKLEGTYERGDENDKSDRKESPTVSTLAQEVNMLGISDLAVPPTSPADKRRSLLIERRRQTMMDIPFTPRCNTPDTSTDSLSGVRKITELLNEYETRDPRLLVGNNEEHVPFILMYDSLSVAQQMTLIERELLEEIDWNELLNLNLTYSAPHVTSWLQLLVQNETLSGIDLAIARFNLTVDWIISEIVLTSDIKLRRNTIQRFIHVAEHCRLFQNYNTLMEIVLALSSTVVQQFSDAWRLIEPGDLVTWEGLKHIPSLDRNYSAIRNLLNNIDPIKGCIPFIVVYLSDLSLNSEKRSWFVEKQVVNYHKFDTNVQIVKNFIQRVQWSKFYDFTADNELLSKCVYLTTLTPEEIRYLTNIGTTDPF